MSILITMAVLCFATAITFATEPPGREDEYRVKAAILYNLAKFVDWPPDALPATGALTVCVIGNDPFGSMLDEAFKGRLVTGRTVSVRRSAEIDPGCHIVFVSSSERKRTAAVLERIAGLPVLTVGDDEAFNAAGGMVELLTDGEQIRFVINTAAAERARLHLSARLLALASSRSSSGVVR